MHMLSQLCCWYKYGCRPGILPQISAPLSVNWYFSSFIGTLHLDIYWQNCTCVYGTTFQGFTHKNLPFCFCVLHFSPLTYAGRVMYTDLLVCVVTEAAVYKHGCKVWVSDWAVLISLAEKGRSTAESEWAIFVVYDLSSGRTAQCCGC